MLITIPCKFKAFFCCHPLNWVTAKGRKMDLSKYNKNVTKIDFESSQITTMNWEGCPPGLTEIDLRHNNITTINWEGCPLGRKLKMKYSKISEKKRTCHC